MWVTPEIVALLVSSERHLNFTSLHLSIVLGQDPYTSIAENLIVALTRHDPSRLPDTLPLPPFFFQPRVHREPLAGVSDSSVTGATRSGSPDISNYPPSTVDFGNSV